MYAATIPLFLLRFVLAFTSVATNQVAGVNVEHGESSKIGPLNSGYFMNAVKSRYFVDKTMLIRIFLDFRENNHLVFLGPKQFGKTVNMDMIKEFVEIETDENGHIANKNNLTKWNVFKKLAIGQDKELFRESFAAFPVVRFVFDMTSNSYDDFLKEFADMIKYEYERQCYGHFFNGYGFNRLKPAHAYNPELVGICKKYTIDPQKLPESELSGAGVQLVNLLYYSFRRPVILLVDEYDGPISHALFNPDISNDDAEKIITFLSKFLKRLVTRGESFVKRSLLTGVTRLGRAYTLEINALEFHRIFDNSKIAPYYGFTREEVINFTKQFPVKAPIDLITDEYGGFKIEKGSSMFCMQSVIQFFNSGQVRPYWNPFSQYSDAFFEFQQMGGYLAENVDKEICIDMTRKVEKNEFLTLKKNIERKIFTEHNSDLTSYLIVQILVDEGVFTIVRRGVGNRAFIQITNREVRTQLLNRIYTIKFLIDKYFKYRKLQH